MRNISLTILLLNEEEVAVFGSRWKGKGEEEITGQLTASYFPEAAF